MTPASASNGDEARVVDPDPDPSVRPAALVDAHVHCFPDGLLDAIYGWFDANTDWTIPTPSADEIVERAAARTDGVVCFPYAHRPGVARGMNEFVAERFGDREDCVALGTVHAADDDREGVVESVFDAGLAGLKLHCPVQGYPPDDPRLDPVYEALVARDAPLVIHASTHPFDRGNPDFAPARFEAVLDSFPALRASIPHLGLFDADVFLDLAADYDVVLDTAVALGESSREAAGIRDDDLPVERLRANADRILFGSDYPVRPAPYADAIQGVRDVFETEEDRAAVFAENARRFFDL